MPFELYLFTIGRALVFLLIILVLVSVTRWFMSRDWPTTSLDVLTVQLRTGDLLGVAYDKPFGWFVSAWSQSIWSHVGIVWQCPLSQELFVIESAYYDPPYRGVITIPLRTWLRINRSARLGWSRLQGLELSPERLQTALQHRRQWTQLDSYNWRWYRLLWKRAYTAERRVDFTCYELVTALLQDVGVIAPLYECSSYFPCDLMHGQADYVTGVSYAPPIELTVQNLESWWQASRYQTERTGCYHN